MDKSQSIAKSVIGLGAALLISLAISIFFAKYSFAKYTNEQLNQTARIKLLEIDSNLSGQLALVRQLCASPSMIKLMQDPAGEETKSQVWDDVSQYKNAFSSKSIFWISDVDKAFWSDLQYSYTLDAEKKENYWYKMTMYETEQYNFNINYNPDLKTTNLWVNAVVRDENRKPIGITGTGIPLSNFIATLYRDIDDSTVLYLYNNNGIVSIAKDQTILGQDIDIKNQFKPAAGIQNLNPSSTIVANFGGYDMLIAPVDILGFHMLIAKRASILNVASYAVTPFCICVVIIVVAIVILMFSQLYSLLRVLRKAVEDLSSGHANLTRRIAIEAPSYFHIINQLGEGLNHFIEKLQGIVTRVMEANSALTQNGQLLKDSTSDTSNAISAIITNISNMENSITTTRNSVESTSSAVTQISSNITSLGQMIENQTHVVDSATQNVSSIIQNIGAVNETATQLNDAFTTLQKNTRECVEKNQAMNSKINQIQDQSKALQDANVTISSIAEETNLLAMNAAIEAAHAGESGKGFAVVADEIRKLSVTSSEQTKTIGNRLSAIETSISEIVETAKESAVVMTTVSEGIKSTDELVKNITNSMSDQKSQSDTLNSAIKDLGDNSTQVKDASSEMTEGATAILNEVQSLEGAAQSISESAQEMTGGANRIKDADGTLRQLTDSLDETIANIGEELNQFEV